MSEEADIKKRFWKSIEDSPFLMVGRQDSREHHLPMTAQLDRDANHEFWFYHTKDGRLAQGGAAMAHFVGRDHDLFACIAGTLVEEKDSAVIDRYWSKQVEAWYPGGRSDPNLLMLRFELGQAEIWTSDTSVKGFFKLLTGKPIQAGEIGQHKEVAL